MPPLMPENEDAERVYLWVKNQYIMAPMGGPISVNQLAVHEAMRLYDVADPVDCFEKVVEVSQHMINQENERNKADK